MKIYNKQAKYNYHILESVEAGIVLTGAEVKSIRAGRADLSQSFARVQNGQVFLKNFYIYPYVGARPEYDPNHDRKLLLHKSQINTLGGRLNKGGMALIPISIYEKHNFFKVELGLGQSKKSFDKRRSLKAKDELRKLEQEIKY